MDASPAPVFVDLDRCLLLDDSISASLTRLVDRGLAPRSTILKGAWIYLGYRMNWIDAEAMSWRAVRDLAGLPVDAVEEEIDTYFHDVARYRYRPRMVTAIERHQSAGQPVYMLTGGLPWLPERIAADLGLDGVGCTLPRIADGRLTGELSAPPCVGSGKIFHAHRLIGGGADRVARGRFYTDSYSDRPLLEVVAEPVAVNPDRKLERLARKRGWPMLE